MKYLLLLLALSVPTFAQKPLPTAEADVLGNLLLIQLQAERCGLPGGEALPGCKDNEEKLTALLADVVRSPRLTRIVVGQTVYKYLEMSRQPTSAMQVSQLVDQQNAQLMPLLVLQNQRIIELLEQIAKKPK